MKGAKVGYHEDPSTVVCDPKTGVCDTKGSAAYDAAILERHSGTVGVTVTIRNGTFYLPKCRFVFTGRWMCIKKKDLL
jgi:hypothetical protein